MEIEQILQLLLLLLFLFGGVIGQAVQRKRKTGGQDQTGPQARRPQARPSSEGEIARRVREMLEAARPPRPAPPPARPAAPGAGLAPEHGLGPNPLLSTGLGAKFESEFTRFKEQPSASWADREDSLASTPEATIKARVHPRALALRTLLRKDPRLAVLGHEVLGVPLGLRPLSEGPRSV